MSKIKKQTYDPSFSIISSYKLIVFLFTTIKLEWIWFTVLISDGSLNYLLTLFVFLRIHEKLNIFYCNLAVAK